MRFPPSLLLFAFAASLQAEPKPVPRMQAVPQAHAQISFQRDGLELTRYHFGEDNSRPYLFPVNGPAGRSLTRIGHPHDPVTHSHHNSLWVSHNLINGVNFWEDRAGGARIVHQRIERIGDSDEAAFAEALNHWVDKDGQIQLVERRRITVRSLEAAEWLLLVDLQLEAKERPVVIGQSAFGPLGVRMAKTIGVTDGGGTIRNSEGGVDEAGCFRKPARWVDYSGPITPTASEGLALLDHPANRNHPVPFHVRNDGWMGVALAFAGAISIAPGESLPLRYGLYVHAGVAESARIERVWREFAATAWEPFPTKR